jgi:hypothetical protein
VTSNVVEERPDAVTRSGPEDVCNRYATDGSALKAVPGFASESKAALARPGISEGMLRESGVRRVTPGEAYTTVGYAEEGILIPYRTLGDEALLVNGQAFARLRLKSPKPGGPKYLSPAAGGCQAYFPRGLTKLLKPDCVLGIVEGEFKAMALVEAGFPCIGIGGICSACPKDSEGNPRLIPALAELIAEVRPSRLAFIGDSDTALLPAFSREALKLSRLSNVPVVLPRIPLDAPGKGPDDLRSAWDPAFTSRWKQILEGAVAVETDTVASLAVKLLEREAEAFRHLTMT